MGGGLVLEAILHLPLRGLFLGELCFGEGFIREFHGTSLTSDDKPLSAIYLLTFWIENTSFRWVMKRRDQQYTFLWFI